MRPEARALLLLLDPEPSEHRERRLVALLRRGIHWARFVAVAERNDCAPFLLFQLRRRELTALVPETTLEHLQFRYEATALRNAVLVRDLEQALTALQRAGVRALALDEAALVASSLYPDRGLRPVSCASLCVTGNDVTRAIDALDSAGYRPVDDQRSEITLVNERGTRLSVMPEPWSGGEAPMTLEAGLRSPLDYLAARFTYLTQVEPPLPMRQVDRWFLNVALADHGLRRLRVHVPARRLADAFVSRRYDTLRSGLQRRVRRFFPNRDEMVRRHGRRAMGLGLYTLYAGRLLSLPASKSAPRRDEPGA